MPSMPRRHGQAHLVLRALLDGLDHVLALEAQLDDLVQDVLVQHGGVGNGVRLHHCQVARQVQREPGVLPARQRSRSAPSASCWQCIRKLPFFRTRPSVLRSPSAFSLADRMLVPEFKDAESELVPDFWDGDALQGIDNQHPRYEVPRAVGQVRGQIVDAPLQ